VGKGGGGTWSHCQAVIKGEQATVPVAGPLLPHVIGHSPMQGVQIVESLFSQHGGVDIAPNPASAVPEKKSYD